MTLRTFTGAAVTKDTLYEKIVRSFIVFFSGGFPHLLGKRVVHTLL